MSIILWLLLIEGVIQQNPQTNGIGWRGLGLPSSFCFFVTPHFFYFLINPSYLINWWCQVGCDRLHEAPLTFAARWIKTPQLFIEGAGFSASQTTYNGTYVQTDYSLPPNRSNSMAYFYSYFFPIAHFMDLSCTD